MTKPLMVPFTADGSLASYPPHDYPSGPFKDYKTQAWSGEWKEAYVFHDVLRYDSYCRGRSAMTVFLKSVLDGKSYPMFVSVFDRLLNDVDVPESCELFVSGRRLGFNGFWTFCKRGQNYSVCPAAAPG